MIRPLALTQHPCRENTFPPGQSRVSSFLSGKITKQAGTENDTICLAIPSASARVCSYTTASIGYDDKTRKLPNRQRLELHLSCHLVYNSLLCTYGFLHDSQSATLNHCKGNRKALNQLYCREHNSPPQLQKMDALLGYGFISSTKSFDSNVSASDIIIDIVSLMAWH